MSQMQSLSLGVAELVPLINTIRLQNERLRSFECAAPPAVRALTGLGKDEPVPVIETNVFEKLPLK